MNNINDISNEEILRADLLSITGLLNNISSDINTKINKCNYFDNSKINLCSDINELKLLLSVIDIYNGTDKALTFKKNFTICAINELHHKFNGIYSFNFYEEDDFVGIECKCSINEVIVILGYIDVVNKIFILARNEEIDNINNKIYELNNSLKALELEENEYILAKKNRLYLANGNPLKLIDMSVRKNKYEKEISDKLREIENNRNYYCNEIGKYKAMLSELELNHRLFSNEQEALADKLDSSYDIKKIVRQDNTYNDEKIENDTDETCFLSDSQISEFVENVNLYFLDEFNDDEETLEMYT